MAIDVQRSMVNQLTTNYGSFPSSNQAVYEELNCCNPPSSGRFQLIWSCLVSHHWVPLGLEKIKLIMMEIEEVKNNIDTEILEARNISLYKKCHWKMKNIVNQLVKGLEQIQIFWMHELWKTTLAKKLYNTLSMVYHFDNCAWCVVSQTHRRRNMLIDISRSTYDFKRANLNMEDESLCEEIYRSLKEKWYLMVMDDISM